MRCYASAREATTTPTALRGAHLDVANTRTFYVLEAGVFNTTATAVTAGLQRMTTISATGAAIDEAAEDPTVTPNAVALGVNTADHTAGTPDAYVQAQLGAAVGAGVIWTFGGKGLVIPGTASTGICLICPNGTGQFRDFYWVWEE